MKISRLFYEFVKKMTERNPAVLKTKVKDLYKILKNIKDRRIRDFLNKLTRCAKAKYIGRIKPKVND